MNGITATYTTQSSGSANSEDFVFVQYLAKIVS